MNDPKINELWDQSQNDAEGMQFGFSTQHHYFAELVRAQIAKDYEERLRFTRERWEIECKSQVEIEREACAKAAAEYGPNRPIVTKNPSSQIIGRWEGEQAASAGIAIAIRARGV